MNVLFAAVLWAGYSVGSWGWCLLKGYDIPLTQWVNPLHPYQWEKGGPAMVPRGQVFPRGSTVQPTAGHDAGVAAANAL